ncbi:major facilitator superfamily domain-containing protein [Podospora appendiculata]|uniref:Major facilitator superfamily domain-containing protein n=1 Tax=Podospora appendiculata TaxID=314037 RepID=A0AAE0WYR2_9PEZI|nr:major facilitator superfamily domain-containing protein [Podospora appendiculata]
MADLKPVDTTPSPESEIDTQTPGDEKHINKNGRHIETKTEILHEYHEEEGYIIDVDIEAGGSDLGIKVAPDGHTRLIPQPSDDENDPLNWTWGKKHLILFIISLTAFLPDYGSATGAVTLLPQAIQWNMTPDDVNHSQAGNVFMLGAGGIFSVIFSAYFGRLPVTFWFILISAATAAWCAGATSFASFMAARILNGFFSTIMQVVGLVYIQDIFFFHERVRKINIWAAFFVLSPYAGPLLAAFMIEKLDSSVPFWVFFALNALALGLIVVFLEETYYDRSIPADAQPARGTRLARLTGVAQWRSRHLRNTFSQACWRMVSVGLKPTVAIACLFYILTFAWAVGINTTLAIFVTPLYGFGPKQVGYFYFTPVVAVLLAEILGRWIHDAIANQYIRSHHGRFEPEVRLRVNFLSMPLVVVGLVLIGQSFENQWHFMALSVCWGLYVFGMMITTVSLSSYCLDSYPEASGEVSALLNFSRTLGGFIISYLQVRWADKQGTKTSFGIQAAVCGFAFLFVLVLLRWGKAMRVAAGQLNFTTS